MKIMIKYESESAPKQIMEIAFNGENCDSNFINMDENNVEAAAVLIKVIANNFLRQYKEARGKNDNKRKNKNNNKKIY